MRPLISVAAVAILVVAAWAVGRAAGFSFALGPSLALSVVATALLSVSTRHR